jgi:hypothetical protein
VAHRPSPFTPKALEMAPPPRPRLPRPGSEVMRRVGSVSRDAILAASGNSAWDTSTMLSTREVTEVWELDPADYSVITVRGPSGERPAEPVSTAKGSWVRWASEGDPRAKAELERIDELESDLRRDGRFQKAPILNDLHYTPSLHDGRHRLIAAHSCLQDESVTTPLVVYLARPQCACHPQ